MNNIQLIHGDCLDKLKELEDNSVDSIVTDPPYGLSAAPNSGKTSKGGFMGKAWDKTVPSVEVWQECLRVLKPGGHLLCFAGTRTHHRMAVNIEDAGFEIRDMIAWVYGSGFPKSHNVSKAIDKIVGAEGQIVGKGKAGSAFNKVKGFGSGVTTKGGIATTEWNVTAPATDEAKDWEGWRTALKPALEPITVARKPFKGSVAENVLKYGTGAINIDDCRVKAGDNLVHPATQRTDNAISDKGLGVGVQSEPAGRFPANLIHDGSEEVVELFPDTGKSSGGRTIKRSGGSYVGGNGDNVKEWSNEDPGYGDSGSAARFFYCAKATKTDRNEGLDGFDKKVTRGDDGQPYGMNTNKFRADGSERKPVEPKSNHHPTVKPTALMRYLVRLVTPPNGTVLDPFMGSGSTGKACVYEGFGFIGIDLEEEYIDIARARIEHTKQKLDKQNNTKATETLNKFFSEE